MNDIEKECEFLEISYIERKLTGQNSFVSCPPIKSNLCKHPEIRDRSKSFYCEPDKHSWCPYNKNQDL